MKYFTFRQPQVKNRVTQEFWARPEFYKQFWFKGHEWIDVNDTPWKVSPVYAVEDGFIVTKRDWAYGNRIDLYCERIGVMFSYCHLSKFSVKTKDKVKPGQLIGYTGNTSTYEMPIHLHFMVKEIDSNLDIVNKKNWYDGSLKCWIEEGMFWYEHPRMEYWKIKYTKSKTQPTPTRNGMYLPDSHGGPEIRTYLRFETLDKRKQKSILEHERSHYVYFELMKEKEVKAWEVLDREIKLYLNSHAEKSHSESFSECWEAFYLDPNKKYWNWLDTKIDFVVKMMHGYQ